MNEQMYRDIFAELTAKAQPLCEDAADPEKITGYRLPVGPIHRAAGKLGFQMFDGERHLQDAIRRIEQLERANQRFGPSHEEPSEDDSDRLKEVIEAAFRRKAEADASSAPTLTSIVQGEGE